MATSEISSEALELHRDALVWDMTMPIITPGAPEKRAEVFARDAAAGIDYQSITLAVDGFDYRATGKQIARYRALVAEQADTAVLVASVDEILAAKAQGKVAIGFHFQGTAPFEEELGFVDVFYQLGIRHALMAYNQHNVVGSGCHVDVDEGLKPFGEALIAEMNRVGMLVDCAHTGYRTMMETVEASTSPVIISHTNIHALREHDRCIHDDQIEACAASGGVMGITGLSVFLGEGPATVERFVDHVDYVAQLVGPEHVGLGLDYVFDMASFEAFVASSDAYAASGGYSGMTHLEIEDAPRITEGLLRRGYGEKEVRGVLGENWLRVCGQVWR